MIDKIRVRLLTVLLNSIPVTYFTPGLSVIDELAENYKKYMPPVFRYEKYAKNPEELDQLTEIYKNYYFGDTEIRENVHAFSKVGKLLKISAFSKTG